MTRAKRIGALLKKNFTAGELTSECAKAIKESEEAFEKFFVSLCRGHL